MGKTDFEKQLNKNRKIVFVLSLLFDVIFITFSLTTNKYSINPIMLFLGIIGLTVVSVYILSMFTVVNGYIKYILLLSVSVFPIAFILLIILSKYNYIISLIEIISIIVLIIYFLYDSKKEEKWKRIKSATFFKEFGRKTIISLCIISLIYGIVLIPKIGNSSNDEISFQYEIDVYSNVEATNQAKTKDNSFSKYYLNELSPIIDGSWDKISQQDKLDIAQIVINIYTTYYGMSNSISVVLSDIKDEDGLITYGRYVDALKTIVINKKCIIDNMDSQSLLITLLHEFYHAYQCEQVELLSLLPKEKQNLDVLSEARSFREGLENYVDGSKENFDSYEDQYVESTARYFGYTEADLFIDILSDHLNNNDRI